MPVWVRSLLFCCSLHSHSQTLGTFLVMNLFVGVIVENFNKMRSRLGRSGILSPRQEEWLTLRKLMFKMHPLKYRAEPKHPLRRLMFRGTRSPLWEGVVIAVLLSNTVVLMLPYFGASDEYL